VAGEEREEIGGEKLVYRCEDYARKEVRLKFFEVKPSAPPKRNGRDAPKKEGGR